MFAIEKNVLSKVVTLLLVLICSHILAACMKTNAAEKDYEVAQLVSKQKSISENTLKVVNAAFYQTFVLGDWRYKGARDLGGTINAYIQIPAPLDMNKKEQKTYLQQAICPSSAHVRMWNEIDGIPLSVHIYTHKQKNSLFVNCTNPFSMS
jgi:hypothetical protein